MTLMASTMTIKDLDDLDHDLDHGLDHYLDGINYDLNGLDGLGHDLESS